MGPLDRLLTELRDLSAEDRRQVWVLRRFSEMGDVTEPPTVSPPQWLQHTIVESVRDVAQHWPQSAFFGAVRMLERLGLVKVEHDDTYVLAMVSCLGGRWDGAVRADALRRDLELRELLWRVFEVEGGGEISLTNVDKMSRADATWAETFRVLVADGTLPRGRVLESCLRALGRDFSAYRAGWFAQLYRGFEPTTGERVEHQPQLLRLLRSAVPATVSFAVGQLVLVAKAVALDDDGVRRGVWRGDGGPGKDDRQCSSWPRGRRGETTARPDAACCRGGRRRPGAPSPGRAVESLVAAAIHGREGGRRCPPGRTGAKRASHGGEVA